MRAVSQGCELLSSGPGLEGMGQWALGTLDRVPHRSFILLHCKTQQLAKSKTHS